MKLFLKTSVVLAVSASITYVCIISGLDWKWAVYFNQHDFWVYCAAPFVLLGMFIPIAIPLFYYLRYRKGNAQRDLSLAKKSFYSFCVAYVAMTVLKVFTNRVDMEPFEPIGTVDISNQFRFGFMNSNSWWESFSEGWPSGHTMIAVAMALSIHSLLQNKMARIINVAYPILVALSVSTAFHWISDVFSGALIGVLIGVYFRDRCNTP